MAAQQVRVVAAADKQLNSNRQALAFCMMNNDALIIFIKNPELGKAKTRIAATLGDEKALEIYKNLIAHTNHVTSGLNADKYLFYSSYTDDDDNWNNELYIKQVQKGGNLGERMEHAFEKVFAKGHQHVCIIGSDCHALTQSLLQEALHSLKSHDAVIGPTYDVGYYLLGMNELYADLFRNKEWSTDSVRADTLNDMKRLDLSYFTLPKLHDVDEEKDVPDRWL